MDDKIKEMPIKTKQELPEVTLSVLDPAQHLGSSKEYSIQHQGDQAVLGEKLSTIGAIALGYTSLSTWSAYSSSAATALASGGANVLVWGILIVGVCNMAAGVTIAEPASQFPNAAGQAAWVYKLQGRFLSYFTSWIVLLGWVFLAVAGQSIVTTIVLAMANLTFPSYDIKDWHVSLTIIAAALFSFVVANFASTLISRINVMAFTISVVGFFSIILTLLVQSRGHYNTVEFALVDIVNMSGWSSSFIPWVLGLSQAALSTTAFDAPAHFSEELRQPSKQVPIAILGSLGTSVIMTLCYAFVLVFTIPQLDEIMATTTGFPFAEILKIKTSTAGAIILLMIPLIQFMIAISDVAMAANRCVYGLSRQHGFPFSRFFGHINVKFDCPLRAGVLTLVVESLIGLIYIGNTAAFNALISAPAILLGTSYSTVAGVCLAARWRAGKKTAATASDKVLHDGDDHDAPGNSAWKPPFKMPSWLTISCNVLTIVFTLLLCVFLSLPPSNPVNGSNTNYTSVFYIFSLIVPCVCWYFYRNVYQGPLIH
ncbi:related to HNM1 - choline permease [Melanopsichium pennsylvanicum]|uniref:Related to HNM1 - choline permease n=2 Tax=Melanopsichium pennsylvanicum TaxID=63383 RepID=A0AAJ4XRG7_9BASI|nr:related to HNM1-choline permease [Melanopsichium pennsylvanicum 4]SNX86943.1 related to HNM1 - choline permease [Melanopsichium pennsylvanicum]